MSLRSIKLNRPYQRMDDIKQHLNTGQQYLTPASLQILQKYKYIDYHGQRYKTNELIQDMVSCHRCANYWLRVSALEARLEKYENPKTVVDLEVVLRDFFEKKYTRTSARVYSRRVLFKEVQIFLEEKFEIHLLHPTDERYRRFIREIVGDTGKGYKRLRIRKKT